VQANLPAAVVLHVVGDSMQTIHAAISDAHMAIIHRACCHGDLRLPRIIWATLIPSMTVSLIAVLRWAERAEDQAAVTPQLPG
jgi:hypothetical protein